MNHEKFVSNMNEAWELKKKVDFLTESLNKSILEAFRDEGIIISNVKIYPSGFSCESKPGINYKSLENITKKFPNFSLNINKTNGDFLYEFKLIKS